MTNSINSLQGNLWKWLLISFGSIVLIYGVLRIVPIMRGVTIKTHVPPDTEMTMDSFMLTGMANHARRLSINGRDILIDPTGAFSDEIVLAPGVNKIKIVAEDIRGKYHQKEIIMTGSEIKPELKTAKAENIVPDFATEKTENN